MVNGFKSGLMMQPSGVGGNTTGKGEVLGSLYVPMGDGDYLEVEITDCRDERTIQELTMRAKLGDKSAARHLATIIKKYDPLAASRLLTLAGENGEAMEVAGDAWAEQSMEKDAFKAFKESARYNHPCGKCKLGRYYAEGKGCKKNLILAKKWLKEAAEECSEAEQYLDQYGLR